MSKPQFAKLPWFPRDFASATRLWPLSARAVYRELLDLQWDIGGTGIGTLPDDEQQLRTLVRATPAEWRIAWPLVAPKFPRVAGGRRNARLEEHRAISVKEYESRQRGAQMTNRKLGRGNGPLTHTLSDSHTDAHSKTESATLSERSATRRATT